MDKQEVVLFKDIMIDNNSREMPTKFFDDIRYIVGDNSVICRKSDMEEGIAQIKAMVDMKELLAIGTDVYEDDLVITYFGDEIQVWAKKDYLAILG